MKHISADIHCHPTLKPYGKSFPQQVQNNSITENTNLYYYDPQTFWDKVINRITGLTEFRQSDFTALKYGGVNIVICSLYPMEKGFCRTEFGTGDLIDDGLNLVTGVGENRINFIQDVSNGYFDDLQKEHAFLQALDGVIVEIDGNKTVYKIIDKFSDIQDNETFYGDDVYVINVIVSFEGTHSLYTNFLDIGKQDDATKAAIFGNLTIVKNWKSRPLFVTLAHHFYNGFCGQAASLTEGVVKIFANQKAHLYEPMNDFGREVVRHLLDNTNNKRILIDIKHMSEASRKDYFDMLDTEFKDQDIPVIVSHGAVIGNATDSDLFFNADINFTDTEILKIGVTKGLFGIQLDKRRIGSAADIKNFETYITRRKVLFHATELIWRQIQHIAELLDANNLFAWGIQCLGSDNDGIVNPVDGIWTSEDFKTMEDYLLMQAHTYTQSDDFNNLNNDYNKIDAEVIVDRVIGNNVYDFLSRNLI